MKHLLIVPILSFSLLQCQSTANAPPCQRNPFPKKLSDNDNVASTVQ